MRRGAGRSGTEQTGREHRSMCSRRTAVGARDAQRMPGGSIKITIQSGRQRAPPWSRTPHLPARGVCLGWASPWPAAASPAPRPPAGVVGAVMRAAFGRLVLCRSSVPLSSALLGPGAGTARGEAWNPPWHPARPPPAPLLPPSSPLTHPATPLSPRVPRNLSTPCATHHAVRKAAVQGSPQIHSRCRSRRLGPSRLLCRRILQQAQQQLPGLHHCSKQ